MKTTDSVMREKWEVEFDEQFDFGDDADMHLKDFISHSLAEARREGQKKAKESYYRGKFYLQGIIPRRQRKKLPLTITSGCYILQLLSNK